MNEFLFPNVPVISQLLNILDPRDNFLKNKAQLCDRYLETVERLRHLKTSSTFPGLGTAILSKLGFLVIF